MPSLTSSLLTGCLLDPSVSGAIGERKAEQQGRFLAFFTPLVTIYGLLFVHFRTFAQPTFLLLSDTGRDGVRDCSPAHQRVCAVTRRRR